MLILMNKKAQATAFVLLGLVLLIIVFFTMFIMINLTNIEFQERADQAVADFVATSSINLYVTSCMEGATKDAVYELFLYGGLDNETFQSLPEDKVFQSNVLGVNSTQHILVNHTKMCGLSAETYLPPSYPVSGVSFEDFSDVYINEMGCMNIVDENMSSVRGGFFGANNFSALCMFAGTQMSDVCSIDSSDGVLDRTVPNFNFNSEFNSTFEKRLGDLIINKTEECVDFELFEDYEGHNVSLIDEPADVSMEFSSDSFSVVLTYPFSVSLDGGQPVVSEYDFVHESDLRLVQFQRLVMSALSEESYNIGFNISNSNRLRNIDFFDDFMLVNYSLHNDEDLKGRSIKFTDTASNVFGNNISTSTFIPARRPVLDYIEKNSILSDFNYVVLQGEEIEIDPFGLDPDDFPVSYFYRGWAENYSVSFNYTRPGCEDGSSTFINFDDFYDCLEVVEDNPQNWTSSEAFLESRRRANISTSVEDIGPRNLTVGVEDIFGLVDYQVLSVMVVEEPSLNLTFNSFFDEMPSGYLSIEDPFWFNATDYGFSPLYEGSVQSSEFKILAREDPNEESGFVNEVFSFRSVASQEEPATLVLLQPFNPNIFNITDEPLTESNREYLLTSELEIYSELVQQTVPATDESVFNSVVCAPYRSDNAAYPYGTSNDEFFNNHTCCIGSFDEIEDVQLAEDDYACFNSNWYGVRADVIDKAEDLTNTKSNEIQEGIGTFSTSTDEDGLSDSNFNSVWSLEFERFCDGSRGNVCGGDVDYRIFEQLSCNNEISHPQCIGPSTYLSENPISCDYMSQGSTFDSIYNENGGSNVCQEEFACSTYQELYDDEGARKCQATCDGEGNCTYPINCEVCDVGTCGAECGEGKRFIREGAICRSDCDTTYTCTLQDETTLPCADEECFIGPDSSSQFDDNTCYFDVGCTSEGGTSDPVECNVGVDESQTFPICRYYGDEFDNDNDLSPCEDGNCKLENLTMPCGEDETCFIQDVEVDDPFQSNTCYRVSSCNIKSGVDIDSSGCPPPGSYTDAEGDTVCRYYGDNPCVGSVGNLDCQLEEVSLSDDEECDPQSGPVHSSIEG